METQDTDFIIQFFQKSDGRLTNYVCSPTTTNYYLKLNSLLPAFPVLELYTVALILFEFQSSELFLFPIYVS